VRCGAGLWGAGGARSGAEGGVRQCRRGFELPQGDLETGFGVLGVPGAGLCGAARAQSRSLGCYRGQEQSWGCWGAMEPGFEVLWGPGASPWGAGVA